MTPDEKQEIESKKLKLRIFILLIIVAFFAYIVFVRPMLKAVI